MKHTQPKGVVMKKLALALALPLFALAMPAGASQAADVFIRQDLC